MIPPGKFNIPALIKPNQFGDPFHGLARNGTLSLPNAQDKDYPQPRHPGTQLIKVPGQTPPNRTQLEQSFDTAEGLQWIEYALVSGDQLYGNFLGYNWIVYIDGNKVPWFLTFQLEEIPGGGIRVRVTLVGRFGVFNVQAEDANVNIEKADFIHPVGSSGGPFNGILVNSEFVAERNSTGSQILVHAYWTPTIFDNEELIAFKPNNLSLADVYLVTISGNGDLPSQQPGTTLGDGINVSIAPHKVYDDMYDETINPYFYERITDPFGNDPGVIQVVDGFWDPSPALCSNDCTGDLINEITKSYDDWGRNTVQGFDTVIETRLFRYVFDASDAIVEYAARRTTRETNIQIGITSGEKIDTTTTSWEPTPEPGPNCIGCDITTVEQTSAGAFTATRTFSITNDLIWETLRNGTPIDSAAFQVGSEGINSFVDEIETANSITSVRTYAGSGVPPGATLDGGPAFSSKDLFGTVVRVENTPSPYYDIRPVATPDGTDSGRETDNPIAQYPDRINGTYHPVTQDTERLTTDQVNFV